MAPTNAGILASAPPARGSTEPNNRTGGFELGAHVRLRSTRYATVSSMPSAAYRGASAAIERSAPLGLRESITRRTRMFLRYVAVAGAI